MPELIQTPYSLNKYIVIWSLRDWQNAMIQDSIGELVKLKQMELPKPPMSERVNQEKAKLAGRKA